MALAIGFKTAPIRVTWTELAATWKAAGDQSCFDSAWLFDHFYPNDGEGSCLEGFVTLTALAPLVPDARIGHLVLANPYRHPGLVAKMAAALDQISGGRYVLGLGAGWHQVESDAFGIQLGPVGQRLRALRAAIRVIRALNSPEAGSWANGAAGGATLSEPPYALRGARNDPPPLQGPGLPIWIGAQGEQVGLRIAAEESHGWNFSGIGGLEDFTRKRAILHGFAERAGRDPAEIVVSAQLKADPADPSSAVRLCSAFIRAGCEHVVLYVDPRHGPRGIDVLARDVVRPLRDEFGDA